MGELPSAVERAAERRRRALAAAVVLGLSLVAAILRLMIPEEGLRARDEYVIVAYAVCYLGVFAGSAALLAVCLRGMGAPLRDVRPRERARRIRRAVRQEEPLPPDEEALALQWARANERSAWVIVGPLAILVPQLSSTYERDGPLSWLVVLVVISVAAGFGLRDVRRAIAYLDRPST